MEKQFEESFEEVYNRIYKSCENRLKDAKNKNNRFLLAILVALNIINFFIYIIPDTKVGFCLSVPISVCILLILMLTGNENYKKIYKQCVIEGLVKGYNEKLYYDYKIGITRMEYSMSKFDTSYDEYFSEDRIYGTLENDSNFQMAEVITKDVSKTVDSQGHVSESKTTTFRGIYGIIRLPKNTLSNITIISNSKLKKFNKSRIEMDSAEFEEYYDCIANDKISAMRIFTAELIEMYIEIVKGNKYGFEVKIIDNMIYFRYKTNQLFEPPMLKNGLDKEFIKKYYKVIYYPIEIMKKTIEAINSVYE